MAEYDIDKILSSIIDTNDSSWQPNEKIPLVTKEIELIKADTGSYLRSNDFDVASILKEGEELRAESELLVEELEACKITIEQETMADIAKSMENYEQIAQEIYHTYYSFDIIYDVLQFGKYIKDFNDAKEARSYTRAVDAVCDLLEFLKNPADGVKKLDIYANTQLMAETIYDLLFKDLAQEWEHMMQFNTRPLKDKMVVTIALPLTDSCVVTVDVLNALELSKRIGEKVSVFANFILKEALTPIVHNECTVTLQTNIEMIVSISEKYNYQPDFNSVMKNLKTFFSFLNKKLNIHYYKDNNFITTVGSYISAEFCDMLIKDCFVHTIPHNLNDLQDYGVITSQIEEFQSALIESNFIKESDNISLLQYMDDLDVLFADRSSEYFLDTARSIMLKDLSVTMSIGVESIPESSETNEDVSGVEAEALEVLGKTIPNSLFYFPRCMISKSAQEILDLVHMVMEQAVQCPDLVCKKLYTTVRLIFELYDAVVPYHHENFLQTIPQYVALFHNNCMYLAHNLLTLGDKWLNLMEQEVDYTIGFVDLVQKMRELGYKHLTIHMQQQRKQILDNIRSSDLYCIDVKDVLDANAEAAVRQCLRQLQLLKNVWIGVFPCNVFMRLMATLVNMFIDELIHRVCTVEDISIEMATQLTEIYSLVVQKAPGLFQDPIAVEFEVKSWKKLQELIFVLGASLKDIESHWSDGTGPLAKHFHSDELRSLIKALFQNTQFRANLLSKIK